MFQSKKNVYIFDNLKKNCFVCKYFSVANKKMEPICRLKDLYRALYGFEKEFLERNGITINEGMILCCLKDGKSKSANELCEFVGLSNSRVSRVINTVETKGFIVRKMGLVDKRQMIFTLTKSGKAKVQEMLKQDLNLKQIGLSLSALME